MPAVPRQPQADSLELPDLDKSEDGREVDVGAFELDLVDDGVQAEDDAWQDSFEADIQVLTDSGSNEAAADLDVGVENLLSLLPETPGDRESDAPPPATHELDEHLDAPLESDEPSSAAELGDDGLETLPELLSEAGDGDAGPDLEQASLPSAPEGEIVQGPTYDSEWLLIGAPCSALWATDGTVLAAGETLMRFGQKRQSDPLPPGLLVSSLALLDTGSVVMASTRGLFELAPGGSWSHVDAPELGRSSGQDIIELATGPGQPALWARLSNGALFRRRSGAWERHEAGGDVRALSSHGRSVVLLVIAKGPTLQLSSDAGTSFRELVLTGPAATVALGAVATAVARGGVVALADASRGLCVSGDGGETFRMVTGAVNVTAVAVGEHAQTPVVFAALHREGKDSSEMILVDPATGHAQSIAELSGQPDEDTEETGLTQALLWADGCLWCGGGYGLVKLRG